MRSDLMDDFDPVSNIWYLLPLLFGLLGGIIAYVGTKNDDNEKAEGFIYLGIFVSVVSSILMWLYIF